MLARYVGRVVYRHKDIDCISRTQRHDNYNSLMCLLRCVYATDAANFCATFIFYSLWTERALPSAKIPLKIKT